MEFHFWINSESSQSSVQPLGSSYEPAFTDHYEILQGIGEGSFALVKLARHLRTGAEVAVKILAKVTWNLPFLSEPDLMAGLDHPHVVQLFQVIETINYVYVIMEYAGRGHLRKLISEPGGMLEEEARRLFRQVVGAVRYCHSQGIVHLDLKPENITLDDSSNVKLIDFGLSTRFTAGQKLNRFWGTLLYLAPEVVQQEAYEGPPVDVWSLGVILYFMLTGSHPFRGKTAWELRRLIRKGTYDVPRQVSREAQSLIREILTVDPTQRPTLEQVMRHPWLSQGEEASPSPSVEALSELPDPAIITTMSNMGYDPYNIWVSLAKKRYDHTMATYLLLKRQKTPGEGCECRLKRVHCRVVGPPVGPVDASRMIPKKCSSEPSLPSTGQAAKQSLHKGDGSASLPAMRICFLNMDMPLPSLVSQPKPVPSRSQPTMSLSSPVSEEGSSSSPGTSEAEQSWDRGTPEAEQSWDLWTLEAQQSQDLGTPEAEQFWDLRTSAVEQSPDLRTSEAQQSQDLGTSEAQQSGDLGASEVEQSQNHITCWKRVRKRIATCLRQLCCVPCWGRSVFRNRVAPPDAPSQDQQK